MRSSAVFALVALAGCSGLEPVESFTPITDPSQLFMALTLDHGAVNLSVVAPYDIQQLMATPRDANGTPLSGLPAAIFSSSDTTVVWVSPDGVLEARAPGTGIQVVAELVAEGNVRHVDTAFVNVTSELPPAMLDTLSIEPLLPATTQWSMLPLSGIWGQILFLFTGTSYAPVLAPRAVDVNGDPVPGLAIEFESLDPDVVEVDPRTAFVNYPYQAGEAAIVARTTAYGVTRADTVVFTVTLPVIHGIEIESRGEGKPPVLSSTDVTIRPGGYVSWANLVFDGDSLSVTFDDPTGVEAAAPICAAFGLPYPAHCDAGNIAPFMSETGDYFQFIRIRHFPQPGVYPYRIEPLGTTGRIVVTGEAAR